MTQAPVHIENQYQLFSLFQAELLQFPLIDCRRLSPTNAYLKPVFDYIFLFLLTNAMNASIKWPINITYDCL